MTRCILLVDDDPSAIRLMSQMLAGLAEIRFAMNGRDALRLAQECNPGVIVLDAQLPDLSGFDVCALLKAAPSTADIPIIFVTSNDAADFEVSGFDVGAADYVTKPVRPAALQARVRTQLRLSEMTSELRRLTLTDALTGVANRRRFDEGLAREWRRCRRERVPLSLMLVDVDHFKLYNDHYGHPAGDECLNRVAKLLVSACQRPADLVARYGGEEFAVVMPATDRQGARHVAGLVTSAMASARLEHLRSPTSAHVTASLGLACLDPASPAWMHWAGPATGNDTLDDAQILVRTADQALYAAKAAGRAQAVLREIDLPPLQPEEDG